MICSFGTKSLRAGLLFSLVLFVGCEEHVCTTIGCPYPVSIEVDTAKWRAGVYTIVLSESGRSFTCTAERSFGAGSAGGGGESGGPSSDHSGYPLECEQTKGKALDSEQQLWMYLSPPLSIELNYRPDADLELTLDTRGQRLVDEVLQPKYEKSYPNGKDCGVCEAAHFELDFDYPSSP